MNWTIIIIETIIMTIAFTAMILIPLVKNSVWWIHDYPKDIQEEYFKTHERVPSEGHAYRSHSLSHWSRTLRLDILIYENRTCNFLPPHYV